MTITQKDINQKQRLFEQKGLNEKIHPPRTIQTGGGYAAAKKSYKAICKADAGPTNTIVVNIINPTTGIEITTGTEGIDWGITAYGNTRPPEEALYACVDRLAIGSIIYIHKEKIDDDGTPIDRWTIDEPFSASIEHDEL